MLNHLLGPSIIVKRDSVEIIGVPHKCLMMDFESVYVTSVLGKYMFRRATWSKIKIDNFFLLEFSFMINKVLQLKFTRSSKRDLLKILNLIKEQTWIKDVFKMEVPITLNEKYIKDTFKLTPFESQWDFLKNYYIIKQSHHLRGLLFVGVPGSGKTLCSIMLMSSLGSGKTIVVCPQNISYSVWYDTLTNEKYWKIKPPKVWMAKEEKPLDPEADFFVIHYELLQKEQEVITLVNNIKKLNKNKPDFKLIVDECHNFNDLNSKRTQTLVRLGDEIKFSDSLPMSGTPFKAIGTEAYTAFSLIDPMFKGDVRQRFKDAYGRSRERLNELLAHRIGMSKFSIESLTTLPARKPVENIKIQVPHPERFMLKNIRVQMLDYIKGRIEYYKAREPEFNKYFKSVIVRYRESIIKNKEALDELDKYLDVVNGFRVNGYNNFEDYEKSAYCKKVEEKIEAFLPPRERKDFRNTKSVVKYVGLKIRGEALGNVLGRIRIDAVESLVQYAELPKYINSAKKKTIIFTDYVDVLKETERHLIECGFKPCVVYGDGISTDVVVKKFAEDDSLNPMITTFKSLKEGYPLIMANQIIMLNAPWRSYIVEQTLARVHREGQTEETFFYMMDLDTGTEENITSRSIDILEWSAEQVEQLMNANFGHEKALTGLAGMEDYVNIIKEGEGKVPNYHYSLFDLF